MGRVGESTMQPVYAGVAHTHDLVLAIQACKEALINASGGGYITDKTRLQ